MAADPNDPEVQAFCVEFRTRTRGDLRSAREVMHEMFKETARVQNKLADPRPKASTHQWLLVPLCALIGWMLWVEPIGFVMLVLCVLFLHAHRYLRIPQRLEDLEALRSASLRSEEAPLFASASR